MSVGNISPQSLDHSPPKAEYTGRRATGGLEKRLRTQKPLVVDLDGTLTKTDTLYELAAHFVAERWSNAFVLLGLSFRNRATLKMELAQRVDLDVSSLPMNPEVLERLTEARSLGRPVVLATASSLTLAEKIGEEWGPFDEVIGSTPGCNLKGKKKAEALVERFGEKGFDYIGNDLADVPVLHRAHEGFLVSPSKRLLKKARSQAYTVSPLGGKQSLGRALLKAMRPHQWAKNLLLLIPALAAQVSLVDTLNQLVVGFIAFSVMASSVYLANDLWDIEHDRNHPRKKNRPLASGELPIPIAAVCSLVLGAISLALSWLALGANFTLALLVYAAVTIAYSSWLKRVPLVDVFVLAALYGVRIVAGAVAVAVPLSPWIIAFSLFAFLSLALMKRFSELLPSEITSTTALRGRGYVGSDASFIQVLGVGSGLMAGVILALYVEDPAVQPLYTLPLLLWVVVPVWLYWVSRLWLLAHRVAMDEDPVLFALKDRSSYVAGAIIVVAVALSR